MPNKNYRSGRAFEYRVKRYFEKKGYYVMRSAGSKGQIDVVAIPTDENSDVLAETLLVQCKHGAKISKKEREELLTLHRSLTTDALCIVAWTKPRGKITFFAWKFPYQTYNGEYTWGEIEL